MAIALAQQHALVREPAAPTARATPRTTDHDSLKFRPLRDAPSLAGGPLSARGSAASTISRVLQAQRSCGNRVVQLQLRSQGGSLPHVQRLSIADVIPDAILDPIKSLVGQVTGFQSDVGSKSEAAASSGQSEAEAAASTAESEVGATATAETSRGESAALQAQTQGESAEAIAESSQAGGETQAGQIEGALTVAEHATDPVRSVTEPPPAVGLPGAGQAAEPSGEGAGPAAAGAAQQSRGGGAEEATDTSPSRETPARQVTNGPPATGGAAGGPPPTQAPSPAMPSGPGASPAAGAETWNCDEASILKKVSSVGREVIDGLTKVVKAVVPESVLNFAQRGVEKLQSAVTTVRQKVDAAKKAVTEWIDNKLQPVRAAVESAVQSASEAINTARQKISQKVAQISAWASEKWNGLKTRVTTTVNNVIEWAKGGVGNLAQRARSLAGRFWDMVPDWLKGPLTGAAAALAAPIALAYKASERAVAWIQEKAAWLRERVTAAAQTATQYLAEKYQKVRGLVTKARDAISRGITWVKNKAAEVGQSVYRGIDKLSGGRLSKWRAAAAERLAELKGEVCAFFGETVGPCVERFVPEPVGAGGTGSATFATKGEITVPIEGVPVKVAAGASVEVKRTSKKYTAVISGEGFAGVGLDLSGGKGGGQGAGSGGGGGSVTVEGTLPNKVLAMLSLGSRSAPGVPIPVGGAKPPAPTTPASAPQAAGGGGGGSVSAEVGKKVSVALTYTFDATADKTTCDGLGGLTAFLASQGAAAVLPPPFSSMAAIGGQMVFADKLTSAKMTLADTGSVSAKGGGEGAAGASASGKLERGVSIESSRDETGGNTLTATLFQSVGGEVAVSFAPQGIGLSKMSAGLGGRQELAIIYNVTRDNLDATFKQSLSGSATLGVFAGMAGGLPAPARDLVQKILACLPGASEATVSFELSQNIVNLRALASAIDGEMNKGSAATAEGAWDAVSGFVKNKDNSQLEFSAKLNLSEKVLSVGASGSADQAKVSGEVSITRGQEIILCPPVRLEGGAAGAISAIAAGATPGNALLCDDDELIRRFGNRRRDLNINPDTDPESFPRPDDPPILETFRRIYNRLDSWNTFIRQQHADWYPEFDSRFHLELDRKRWLDELKERAKRYKEEFRDLTNTDPQQTRSKYEAYVLGTIQAQIDERNRLIAAWYRDKTGSTESIEEIIERIHGDGTELWRAAWRAAIIQVNRVLAELWPPAKAAILQWLAGERARLPGVDLSGSVGELDYIGSLATGYKGPPKQQIRFNPDKYDVDANLPAPPLAKYAIAIDHIAPDRQRIFARTTSIGPLKAFADETHAALGARAKGYDKSDPFDVAIDSHELPVQERQRRATERLYQLRAQLEQAAYVRLIEELTTGGYLDPDSKAVRPDLTTAQFNEMNAIMDRYARPT